MSGEAKGGWGNVELRINGWKAPGLTVLLVVVLGGGGSYVSARASAPDVARLEEQVKLIDTRLEKLDRQLESITGWRGDVAQNVGNQLALLTAIQGQLAGAVADVRRHEQAITRLEAERDQRKELQHERR